MPKKLAADLAETIQAELARHPLGAGMDALHGALGGLVSRRTLQRRLAALVEAKRVLAQGEARGVKYVLGPQFPSQFATTVATVLAAQEPAPLPAAGEVYVPTSPAGEEIRAYVRQPRQLRKPVSYKQSFLEQYTPNGSAYLPESLRAQLHAMGSPPVANTPAGTFARDILNRLLIDLSWASSQLEGNTYSRLDTERLIEFQAERAAARAAQQQLKSHNFSCCRNELHLLAIKQRVTISIVFGKAAYRLSISIVFVCDGDNADTLQSFL